MSLITRVETKSVDRWMVDCIFENLINIPRLLPVEYMKRLLTFFIKHLPS